MLRTLTDLQNSTQQSHEEFLELDEDVEQWCFDVEEENCQIEDENIEIENLDVEKGDPDVEEEYLKIVGLQIEFLDSKPSQQEPNKEATKSKKKSDDPQKFFNKSGDVGIRNLMNASIEEILATFPEHETYLTELYGKHVKQLKRNYKPSDVPDMIALDIVNSAQFEQMVDFLEGKLVRDLEREHTSSDIIFDCILPEWALRIFCKKFDFTRSESVKYLQRQTAVMNNMSDSE